jgi:hypothetical protein
MKTARASNAAKRVLRNRGGAWRMIFSTRRHTIMACSGDANAACRASLSS